MKVPYLKEHRRSDMNALALEFSAAIKTSLDPANITQRLHSGWLNSQHSLFALLQLLLEKRSTINPSREFALEGARSIGEGATFLAAMNSFGASRNVITAMQKAHSATMFSGFIQELRSDLLMAFVSGLTYSYRNVAICLRCALEDLYRHLYYMDHPQEYRALIEDREDEYGMKLTPQAFREYIKRTSYLKDFARVNTKFLPKMEGEGDYFSVNESLYGSFSAAVHGSSEDWFAALQNASSLQFNQLKEEKLSDLSSKLSKMSIAFLIAAHRDVFSAAGDYDKSIVFSIFTDEERKNLRRFLNL